MEKAEFFDDPGISMIGNRFINTNDGVPRRNEKLPCIAESGRHEWGEPYDLKIRVISKAAEIKTMRLQNCINKVGNTACEAIHVVR